MTRLETLDLYNNELRSIPDGFGSLSSLKTIYVKDSGLPDAELARLRVLLPAADLSDKLPSELYLLLK
jgi:Leucine-rich repeat (LRR) protein